MPGPRYIVWVTLIMICGPKFKIDGYQPARARRYLSFQPRKLYTRYHFFVTVVCFSSSSSFFFWGGGVIYQKCRVFGSLPKIGKEDGFRPHKHGCFLLVWPFLNPEKDTLSPSPERNAIHSEVVYPMLRESLL